MKKILFLCTHNSCRSQMAEALAVKYGEGVIEAYSAGTELKDRINPDAVRIMKEKYDIDMERTQKPKTIDDVPEADKIITMGCGVACPVLFYDYESEDWGLQDPTGKGESEFIKTAEIIERKVKDLIENEKNK